MPLNNCQPNKLSYNLKNGKHLEITECIQRKEVLSLLLQSREESRLEANPVFC